jgi:hypothetical protein
MKQGLLSRHFKGIAAKRLSAVEADTDTSNQHEFNGVGGLKNLFGTGRRKFKARFIWLGDEQEGVSADGFLTWYDAREAHPTRSEYRFYFPTTPVSELANAGDTLFVALRSDDTVLVVITPAESTIEAQLVWLFGLPEQPKLKFESKEVSADDSGQLEFAVRYIFDELEIEFEEPEGDYLDGVLAPLGDQFPTTAEFSTLARTTLPEVSPRDDPDKALVAWMDREEFLFKRMERHILGARLKQGFVSNGEPDFEGFNRVSLSVQNRRKARAGAALENHLEHLFRAWGVWHGRGCETENRYKPDFLFPSCAHYRNLAFPASSLTMLGAKSTLKDRWRQILSEAARIDEKHLVTLSPVISVNQTDQMKASKVQLVVPSGLHLTYQASQRAWLMTVRQFLDLVNERQRHAPL